MFISIPRIFPLFSLICTLFPLFLMGCGPLSGPEKNHSPFRVYFLDVGQGDACLLRTPAGHFFLYDVGNKEEYLLPFLRSMTADTIDAVFISHPDLDHFGAFPALLHEFPIKKVYLPSGTSQDGTWLDVLKALDSYPTKKETLLAGDTLILDGDVRVRALWPYSSAAFEGNNLSLVMRAEYGSHAILLTGDVEDDGEKGILAAGSKVSCDILKVAHHGSRSSNGLPFLSAARPRWAVISCDGAVYGHPHAEAVADLNYVIGDSSRILRTDRVGTIAFDIDELGVRRLEAGDF
jgi:competence protein ComEC